MLKASPTLVYTPYGYRKSRQSQLGFNGELHDALSGLYSLGNGHRMFSPILMRFHIPDKLSPFGMGGLNSYAYCKADPVNRADPSGRYPTLIKRGAKLLAVGGATWAAVNNRDFIKGVGTTSKMALTRGPLQPGDFPEPRYNLFKQANKADRPFNNAVNGVNFNLGTHGDGALSPQQAHYYTKATWSDESNTTLHLHSTAGWALQLAQTGDPAAATGALFNGSATFISGVLDQKDYKTGAIFQLSVSDVRQ
ncbi:RHS repeat-associated core domain-containing protein [Pseudomonas putida]|uniref:RHS repeat-associated core domain-containing protein n=1 Tax=Pseudomonas putida TaxID=303 RepID=UPI0030CCFE25